MAMSYSKTDVAPASLVNSTIAMAPVLCGLLAYDQMVRGNLSMGSLIVAAFCVQNIMLCFFWRRLESEFVKSFVLYLTVAFQWGYVATITAALWLGWKDGIWWANGIGLGVCAGALALFSIKLGTERIGSSAIFSVLGVIATSVWGWTALSESKTELFAKTSTPTTPRTGSASLLARLGGESDKGEHKWSYSGDEGPHHWAALKQEFSTCGSGREQSPIDIPRKALASSTNIQLNYKVEVANVANNGHNLQVSLGGSSTVRFDGSDYALKQFHFHTPSEHTVSGLMYPMEVHFVHANAQGHLLILGTLVERGMEHAEFAKVLGTATSGKSSDGVEVVGLDVAKMMPKDTSTWKYKGSLTTPPCTENVSWAVFSSPMELSERQIASFRALYPINARPVQPHFDRHFETKFPALAH